MERTRSRTLKAVAVGGAAALCVGAAVWSPGGASAGSSGRTWQDGLAAVSASGAAPEITAAEHLRLTAHDNGRAGDVDTGRSGPTPGDYYVFQERLTAPDGSQLGTDGARCMLVWLNARSTICDGSFLVQGRGQIDVYGVFSRTSGPPVLAITGGTGDFQNARGQARIVGGTGRTTDFVFDLLP